MPSPFLKVLVAAAGAALLVFVLVEGFETLVLPRRIGRRIRFTRLFYKTLWRLWSAVGRRLPGNIRDTYLSVFGPLSLLLLLTVWAMTLIFGFACFDWGSGATFVAPDSNLEFGTYIYFSATTFITLGFGDVVPRTDFARFLADFEAGLGFGFLAIVIGYLPVLYGAFSKRETEIALLDARASSPPSAGELLRRHATNPDALVELLAGWERWSAELLESHLSYPVLAYYRSQHEKQSWLNCLTTLLDTCALLISDREQETGPLIWQARLTFAMARHAAVDIALVFNIPPRAPAHERLSSQELDSLRAMLEKEGMELCNRSSAVNRLTELRGLYEPYVNTLSLLMLLPLPNWLPDPNGHDNWQTSTWNPNDHFFQTGKTGT